MQNQLQKAIDLTKKIGDRLIVFSSADSQYPYVVMSLADYEKLVVGHNEVRDLTENELLDKINRDIAIWKSENDLNDFDGNFSDFNSVNNDDDDIDNINIIDNFYRDEEEEGGDSEFNNKEINDLYDMEFSSPNLKEMGKSLFSKAKHNSKTSWSIPLGRKRAVEEDVEEDRQYLEDVPF